MINSVSSIIIMIMIILIIIIWTIIFKKKLIFQENNIFGTDASLTYGPQFPKIDILMWRFLRASTISVLSKTLKYRNIHLKM